MKRGPTVALALAIAALSVGAVPVLAATPTTTVMTLETADVEFNHEVCISVESTVTADGSSFTGGKVTIYDTTSGSDVFYFDQAYSGGSSVGWCKPDGYPIGHRSFRADYSGNATYDASSDTLEFDVPKMTPQFSLTTVPASPDAGSPYQLTAGFTTDGGYAEQNTVEVHLEGVVDPICSGTVSQWETISCGLTAPSTPGTLRLTVTSSESASVQGATSDPFDVVVQANSVHASGLKIQYGTFYPVNDGYRDTVAISGTRAEPISVTIKVYTPGGSLIKTQAIASGTGAYSYTWTGRRSDGSVLPEGKYKITQRLQDGIGAATTSTFYVTLSKKKLIWRSATVVKKGSAISSYGSVGNGSVAVNSAGTLRLKAPSPFYDGAAAGWQFGLATGLSYRQIQVAVYASHVLIAGGQTSLGSQNFATCAYDATGDWYDSCMDSWKSVGNSFGTTTWYQTKVLTSTHRYGKTVRSFIVAYGGTTFVYKARVTYQYATLGY